MIVESLNEISKNKDISVKTKIIFESYIDTLKRRREGYEYYFPRRIKNIPFVQ